MDDYCGLKVIHPGVGVVDNGFAVKLKLLDARHVGKLQYIQTKLEYSWPTSLQLILLM